MIDGTFGNYWSFVVIKGKRMSARTAIFTLIGLAVTTAAYSETLPTNTYSVRHYFGANHISGQWLPGDGKAPVAAIVKGPDGAMYGTTQNGGSGTTCPEGCGTVYRIERTGGYGNYQVIYSFSATGDDGAYPQSDLAVGADGLLYGTTTNGGLFGWGTIFRVSPQGLKETLHSFNGTDGAAPYGRLTILSDSSIVGVTAAGGANFQPSNTACGTLFRRDSGGALYTLKDFSVEGGAAGCVPSKGLVLASDGNLWGATLEGGQGNQGVIFKVSPNGSGYVVVRTLANSDGRMVQGPLAAANGALYGAAAIGGQYSKGTVFRITTSGTFTVLRSFNSTDGAQPVSGLSPGPDGRLYGTVFYGGRWNCGGIYRVSTSGQFSLRKDFAGCIQGQIDGSHPTGAVYLEMDGLLWGTTVEGGVAGNRGIIFWLPT